MKLLLDTHVFLWYISDDPRLPAAHDEAIKDSSNEVFLSVVSVWEATVKHKIGKLSLPLQPAIYLPSQRERHEILSLPLDEPSVAELSMLPDVHRDPFDRMLICQARHHQLTVVTVDPMFRHYPVDLLDSK